MLASAPLARAVAIAGLQVGTDITVSDNQSGNSWGGADGRTALPYGVTTGGAGAKIAVGEDNEVTVGALQGQAWDLEAIFYNASNARLTIMGGYDFAAGNGGYKSGDMMIDITPFGDQNNNTSLNYVIDFAWNDNFVWGSTQTKMDVNYTIYKVTNVNQGTWLAPTVPQFVNSGPWRFTNISAQQLDTGTASVYRDIGSVTSDNNNYVFANESRYALMIGGKNADEGAGYVEDYNPSYIGIGAILADIQGVQTFGTKFTMACGNDEILGFRVASNSVGVPDSSTTLILIGASLFGFFIARRKM